MYISMEFMVNLKLTKSLDHLQVVKFVTRWKYGSKVLVHLTLDWIGFSSDVDKLTTKTNNQSQAIKDSGDFSASLQLAKKYIVIDWCQWWLKSVHNRCWQRCWNYNFPSFCNRCWSRRLFNWSEWSHYSWKRYHLFECNLPNLQVTTKAGSSIAILIHSSWVIHQQSLIKWFTRDVPFVILNIIITK